MAKHSNVIYFSLSKEFRDKLEGYQREAESLGLAAKRLLLGILDDSQASAEPIPPSELEDIKTRLEAVEHGLMVLARARKSKTPTE